MGCGLVFFLAHLTAISTSCWLRESIPCSHPGQYAQLPWMDHDDSKRVMPVLFFYARNLFRAELVLQVCPKRSKDSGGAWTRWGARMVLIRERWKVRKTFCPASPFLNGMLFYEYLKLWESWDAKPKKHCAWKKGRVEEEGLPWHNWAASYTCPETANAQTSF